MTTKINQIYRTGALLLCAMQFACNTAPTAPISLEGNWRFAIDSLDKGTSEKWYASTLNETIKLPGSLQEQGYGKDVSVETQWTGQIVDKSWFNADKYEAYRQLGNVKVPFWLNPEKHYVGAAWYQRDIEIPETQGKKKVFLTLERTHWETTLYIDDKKIGTQNSLGTPHVYELSDITPGKHTLSMRVDNRMVVPVGNNAHSVSDHTQSNWNGIVGRITISERPSTYIDVARVYPNAAKKTVRIDLTILNPKTTPLEAELNLSASLKGGKHEVTEQFKHKLQPGENQISRTLSLGDDAQLWSEFTPNVYTLSAKMKADENETDLYSTDFGLRDIGKQGRQFTINGNPIFLRGTLECCIFPLTGYPATDHAYWNKIYSTVKSHGLNHVRFHSWCPPKAAFEVADSLGVYLQVECGAWTDVGTGNSFDKWVYEEGDRILKEYGNHPSFFAMLHGNEPGGNSAPFLTELCKYWKEKDNRHVYSSSGGWPYVETADFFNSPTPRIQGWGEGLRSKINAQAPETAYDFREIIKSVEMPTISHEIGQWCAYPNLEEISKYTGVLKAGNFEIFKESLAKNNMSDLAHDFLMASGKLQTLCYKADIEAALRTPEFAGFQLLDLHDFPGQGTALVGVLDAFWDSKGYVSAEEFSRFCNTTVPLARMQKLTYTNKDTLNAALEIAHFADKPIKNATINWILSDGNKEVAAGSFTKDINLGNNNPIGNISLPLNNCSSPQQLKLTAEVKETGSANDWNIWVYPSNPMAAKPENTIVTSTWNTQIIKELEAGKNVILTLPRGTLKADKGGDIQVGFSSIFWNTAWTSKQPPHTLGILCDPKHPALAQFPTDFHSDYQWWDIMTNCDAIVMDDFDPQLRPIVHIVDDWFTNRKLGLLFEGKVGNGKLLVTSVDISSDKTKNSIVLNQFKNSIFDYVGSANFVPQNSINPSLISNLLK